MFSQCSLSSGAVGGSALSFHSSVWGGGYVVFMFVLGFVCVLCSCLYWYQES